MSFAKTLLVVTRGEPKELTYSNPSHQGVNQEISLDD